MNCASWRPSGAETQTLPQAAPKTQKEAEVAWVLGNRMDFKIIWSDATQSKEPDPK
jgi:hypothetical protein